MSGGEKVKRLSESLAQTEFLKLLVVDLLHLKVLQVISLLTLWIFVILLNYNYRTKSEQKSLMRKSFHVSIKLSTQTW